MRNETRMIYEVRSEGSVVAQFTSETPAKREMRRLRKEGREARIYTRFVRDTGKDPAPKRKVRPCTPDTRVNQWLQMRNLAPVERDVTFRELYVSTVADGRALDDTVGECTGRRESLAEGLSMAMDNPVITREYILRTWDKHTERWMPPDDWEVDQQSCADLERYWTNMTDPMFLGCYKKGRFCAPDERDSDLSVQPSDEELRLCYRDLGRKQVFTVLKGIEYVRCLPDRMEMSGKDSAGHLMTYSFPYAGSREKKEPSIKEGWYVLAHSIIVFVQYSDTVPDREDGCDGFLDYVAVYPDFGSYSVRTGLIPYTADDKAEDVLGYEFGRMEPIEYVKVNGAWELSQYLLRSDLARVREYFGRYPKLAVFAV